MAAKLSPSDSKAQQIDKSFLDYVIHVKTVHFIFKQLFENDKVTKMMEKVAHTFFLDLNVVLQRYLLLEIIKISDPAVSGVTKTENFTIANIIESIDWPKDILNELNEIKKEIDNFRKQAQKARYKVIAHFDKETVLGGLTHGEFAAGEDDKIIESFEKMANIIHKACSGTIYGDLVITGPGDVYDFIKSLRYAIAFKRKFDESKGEELIKLDQYLDEAEKP